MNRNAEPSKKRTISMAGKKEKIWPEVMCIIGPSGCGKGTLVKHLRKVLGIKHHVETGELFRCHIGDEQAGIDPTAVGKLSESFVDAGAWVPDEITNLVILDDIRTRLGQKGLPLDRLSGLIGMEPKEAIPHMQQMLEVGLNDLKFDASQGWVFDTLRTDGQVEFLARITGVDLVLDMHAADDQVIAQIKGRAEEAQAKGEKVRSDDLDPKAIKKRLLSFYDKIEGVRAAFDRLFPGRREDFIVPNGADVMKERGVETVKGARRKRIEIIKAHEQRRKEKPAKVVDDAEIIPLKGSYVRNGIIIDAANGK